MDMKDSTIAVFADHTAAETAIKQLSAAGFEMKHLSIVGKGYHTDEKVLGFYTDGDRIRVWGARGAFWGALWSLFFGGLLVTVPVVGPVLILGYLAAAALSAVEGAVIVGGMSAIGAALYGIGVPKDSVILYEADVTADKFLVMAHGTAEEMIRARAILKAGDPSRLEHHAGQLAEPRVAAHG